MKRLLLFFLFLNVFSFRAVESVERPIVVVICSYNTIKWTKKTLDSVFNQAYKNYRVIYVDDASTDGNAEFVAQYIQEHHLEGKVTYIQNKTRQRKMSNLYKVLYLCEDNEIVFMLDGDDWCAHNQVFKRINAAYDDPKVWFTYGQYRNEPGSEARKYGFDEKGYCTTVPGWVVKKHAYRKHIFLYMHPRSFYAWLFKMVKLEDLIAERVKGWGGKFYPASNDLAMYYPMVEMAHKHIAFIPDLLYVRNLYSDLVGFKADRPNQHNSSLEIRRKSWYRYLRKASPNRLQKYTNKKADIYIVCAENASHLPDMIESIKTNVKHVGYIYIFYLKTKGNRAEFESLKSLASNILLISYEKDSDNSLWYRITSNLRSETNKYVVLMTDAFDITGRIDLNEPIYWLERTFAYGFYLSYDYETNTIPPHVKLNDDICAWKFKFSKGIWEQINSLNMVLYRKRDIRRLLRQTWFETPGQLKLEMHQMRTNKRKIGLFYTHANIKKRQRKKN